MERFSHDYTMSDGDFHKLVQFIQENYGIDLSKKKQLICSRLSNSLKAKGYPDFRSFVNHLFTKKDPDDLELLLNKLTTNYTFFMRERDHFTYFSEKSCLSWPRNTKKTGFCLFGAPAAPVERNPIRCRST